MPDMFGESYINGRILVTSFILSLPGVWKNLLSIIIIIIIFSSSLEALSPRDVHEQSFCVCNSCEIDMLQCQSDATMANCLQKSIVF